MTVGRFGTAATEVTIGGFYREHAKGELRTWRSHEILRFLSPRCSARGTRSLWRLCRTLEHVNQPPTGLVLGILKVPVQYWPSKYLQQRCGDAPNYGYLTLLLLKHGELTIFHRLMKYGEPVSARKAHLSPDTYSYKCVAGLKTLLVEYLLMQNRHLTGKEKSAKTREEMREAKGGIPLLTDLCLAMRSDPVGDDQGTGSGGDLCLWANRNVRLPGSACGTVPTFGGARQPDQRSGRDGTELVPKRRLESAKE